MGIRRRVHRRKWSRTNFTGNFGDNRGESFPSGVTVQSPKAYHQESLEEALDSLVKGESLSTVLDRLERRNA